MNPTPEQIKERARLIWEESGRPEGSDERIWLEAERQLAAGRTELPPAERAHPAPRPRTDADRLQQETAAAGSENYLPSPPLPDADTGTPTAVRKAPVDPDRMPADSRSVPDSG